MQTARPLIVLLIAGLTVAATTVALQTASLH
jgi:hypothetical protein